MSGFPIALSRELNIGRTNRLFRFRNLFFESLALFISCVLRSLSLSVLEGKAIVADIGAGGGAGDDEDVDESNTAETSLIVFTETDSGATAVVEDCFGFCGVFFEDLFDVKCGCFVRELLRTYIVSRWITADTGSAAFEASDGLKVSARPSTRAGEDDISPSSLNQDPASPTPAPAPAPPA